MTAFHSIHSVRRIAAAWALVLVVPASVQACADNDVCSNTKFYCSGGDGDGGSPVQCTSDSACKDSNPCTEDKCDSNGFCAHSAVDGRVIDDGECSVRRCAGSDVVDELKPAGTSCGMGLECTESGECKSINGSQCADGGGCASGICADGVCCDHECDFECMACDLDGSVGTCAPVPMNQKDDSCDGAYEACDGAYDCKGVNGAPCLVDDQCLSGNCTGNTCHE